MSLRVNLNEGLAVAGVWAATAAIIIFGNLHGQDLHIALGCAVGATALIAIFL